MTRNHILVGLLAIAGLAALVVGAGAIRFTSPPVVAVRSDDQGPNHVMSDGSVMDDATHPDAHAAHDEDDRATHDPGGGHDHPVPAASAFPTGIVPTRIEIPAIGVDATIIHMDITANNVEVPSDFSQVAWWRQTRLPGEIGPSVMGGHVDSRSGPAVFFRLKDLTSGDQIIIHGEDGGVRTFVVEHGLQANKYDRPPEVFGYGQTRSELRLITCSGRFDPSIGHYEDNYVIFAHELEHDAVDMTTAH
jgi:hypothetical protein